MGVQPMVLDVLDARRVHSALGTARPDAIVYEAAALARASCEASTRASLPPTARGPKASTTSLLLLTRLGSDGSSLRASPPNRPARADGSAKTDDDPLEADPPPSARRTFVAMRYLDEVVVAAGGIALRYGGLYCPGGEALAAPGRKRRIPLIGDGHGGMSFVHLDDAVTATVAALEHDGRGIYNVVDDDPAPMREWLPELAGVVGAKPPRRLPAAAARLVAGAGSR